GRPSDRSGPHPLNVRRASTGSNSSNTSCRYSTYSLTSSTRGQRVRPAGSQMLVDGREDEPDHHVVAHDRYELDHALLPELLDDLGIERAVYLVIAKERSAKADDQLVLLLESLELAVVLDGIDNGIRHPHPARRRFMCRPLIGLLELPRGMKDRNLVVASGNDAVVAQVLIEGMERFGDLRAVHRDGRGAGD